MIFLLLFFLYLKGPHPSICKFFCFSSDSDCSYYLTVFFDLDCFLFWEKGFYFELNVRISRWLLSDFNSFQNQFSSDHFFSTDEIASFTILIILSVLLTFTLSKRVKTLVITCENFFRSSFSITPSISDLILSTISLISSNAPSVSSRSFSFTIKLESSSSISSKRYVGSLLFSVWTSETSASKRFLCLSVSVQTCFYVVLT